MDSVGRAVAAAAAAAVVFVGCGNQHATTSSGSQVTAITAVKSTNASRLFADRCAPCHGTRGQGGAGSRLNAGATVRRFPNVDDEIAVVDNGAADGRMPAFRGSLTPEEIRAVVQYTRALP